MLFLGIVKTRICLFLLIAFSFLLRWVQASLNYSALFGDELALSEASLKMMQQNLSNIFFGYGDVCKVPYFIIDCIYYLYGVWKGIFNDVGSVFPKEAFVYVNRLWNVFFGALAIWPAYLIGKKLLSREWGWVMALLVFANPLQFKYSLYTNPDSTAFFFQLVSILFALDIGSQDKRINRWGYIGAGLFLALATGAKVNFALGLLFPLLMHLFNPRQNLFKKIFDPNLALFFLTFGLGYLAVSPTVWVNVPTYLNFWITWFFSPDSHLGSYQVYGWHKFLELFQEIQRRILGHWFLLFMFFVGPLWLLQDWKKRNILIVGLILTAFFSTLIHADTGFNMDAHALFPMLPYILIFTAAGIQLFSFLLTWVWPRLKSNGLTLIITCILIFSPLNKTIINWKIDYTNSKQSFIDYFFKGYTAIQVLPIVGFSEREKESFGSSEDYLWKTFDSAKVNNKIFSLKGPKAEIQKVCKRESFQKLTFWVYPEKVSSQPQNEFTITLSAVQHSLGYKRKMHENRYHLFLGGHRNWKEVDIEIKEKLVPEVWTQITLPLQMNFKQDGIPWEEIDYLLLKINLVSPSKTLAFKIKNIEFI